MPDLFVGRSAELGQIAATLRRVAGGEPWLIAIEGDPGMGKSALARHALAQEALSGVRVLPARPGPDGRSRTAGPAGPRERGQHGLHPGARVRGHGPGPGQPGQRRLPGHGRRAGPLAGPGHAGRAKPGPRPPWQPLLAEGLIGSGQFSPGIAAELFASRKVVEYHLGNIYAKYGIHSRQALRRLVGQWRAASVS